MPPEPLPRLLGSDEIPEDPTVAQIAEAFGWSYTPEGVVLALWRARDQVATVKGRRDLYGRALALAEGVFS